MPNRARLFSLLHPRFTARSGWIGPLALILTWLLAPPPARAQEFAAGYVWAASDNAEFPTAKGGEVQALVTLGSSRWQLEFDLHRIWARTQRESQICRYYAPPTGCQTEETLDKVRLAGFRAALIRPLLSTSHAQVKLGGGVSLSSMTILSSTGLVSHRPGDIYPPSGADAGVFGLLTLDLIPIPAAGLAIRLGVLAHWVDFDSCSETYHRYDPFCSPATFREVQAGLSYSVPR